MKEDDHAELLDVNCTLATWHSLVSLHIIEKDTTAPGGPPQTTENTYLVSILWFLLDDLRDEQPLPDLQIFTEAWNPPLELSLLQCPR